jgi:hypothetical protein
VRTDQNPAEEPEDQAAYHAEIIRDVGDQMIGRLEITLSYKDDLAVTTALGKAALRGWLRGVATAAYESAKPRRSNGS